MPQKQVNVQEAVNYYFLKSKDFNHEDDPPTITLFCRLSRETTYTEILHTYSKTDTFWVDIDEMKYDEAPEKVKELPNQISRFAISEAVFKELYKISLSRPKELYYITPYFIQKL
ncbi:hypothetical protein BN1080_02665 [Planococcus massiliensis]|uniref:Uncharacterized protein n=1 Tax=Planococcus massiliensis TaxID=1499687 RepID=A0A098EQT1_9BACL|nr:hypothetical protein [Planococcus massiliensis]CEG23661.1 hypothetical protein BN1080_02665 [Planococcus massiliensis]